MNYFKLYTSNRLEILVEKLIEVLRSPLPSPLKPEIIVVQSKGMERWVSTEIARRLGICANVKFPFPNTFVSEIIQKVIPDIPEESPFDPKFLTWKIMKLLPFCIKQPGFESINNYLDHVSYDLKCYQLSVRIADTFDQYLLYRPDWIFKWEKGEEDHWQAMLWRELITGNENFHRAALGSKFLEQLQNPFTAINNFPQRVSVFGISSLPLFHFQILAAISRFSEVNLFMMNPSREYWFDILSDREIKRAIDRSADQYASEQDLHIETGNSLLASMGLLGKDFLGLIYDYDIHEIAEFEESNNDSLLSRIQSDILNLRENKKSSSKYFIREDDFSIQIHTCHSPIREIEVLHDQLLKMFEYDPNLLPKDILVMTPDIEIYAPYIQAVFDLPLDDPRRIPFNIADRSMRKESQVIETFLAILDLYGSRFKAAQVIAILESPTVRQKFGLSEADANLIRRWIADTRIRWGIDKESRDAMGLPSISENTWRSGLDRLLLGYALVGHDENMFNEILPYDHIEGNEMVVLGNFLEFVDSLFMTVDSIGKSRTLEAWSEFLKKIIDHFFKSDEENQHEFMLILQVINDLVNIQRESDFSEPVPIQIVRDYLVNQFEQEIHGFGFMTGGITLCAMLPMRSIPFKVICLIGMNDNAYPRQEKKLGFNLMTKHPRPGDRSRRKDDRYLFLEALLSAREKLYISYVGQSIQDNSTIPPSVLISELLDYIDTNFQIPGKNIFDHLIIKHRLQAFSPEYFKSNPRLFSYSYEHFQAAKKLLEPRPATVAFISKGIKIPPEEWKKVTVVDLCNFYFNPTKYMLTKRLGIQLKEEILMLDETEAFDIENLDRYLLEQKLVSKKLDGQDLKDYFKAAKAAGVLPHGTVGNCVYDHFSRGVERFVQQTQPYIQDKTLEPLNINLIISDFNLVGRVDCIYPERLLCSRYAKIKSKDRLRIWIYHLILNSVEAENYPKTSLLVGLNPDFRYPQWAAWKFPEIEKSQEILNRLLEIYWQGLRKPVHFFPESSWEYAHGILEKNKTPDDALKSARNVWMGSDYNHGECEDYYYQLCFSNIDPIADEFQYLAMEIFRPIISSQMSAS